MLNYIKSKISKFRKKIYNPRETDEYYGEFIGSLNFWKLLLWNFLYFEKFFFMFRNNQIKLFNYFKLRIKLRNMKESEFKQRLNFLNSNGYLIIQDYFSLEQINSILNDNSDIINELKSGDKEISTYRRFRGVPLNQNLVNIWLDDHLINLMEGYMNSKIYSRMYPTLNFTQCTEESSSKKIYENPKKAPKTASYWHVDYTTTMSITVFLSDIGPSDTRMQIVPKTNLNLNTFYKISDETVEKKKIKIVDCIGKKGSVMIHCGNVVHRMKGVKGSNRLGIHYMFSPGTNIALDVDFISSSLSKNYDLENLSHNKREIVKGLFPKKVRQGYNIKGQNILFNNFKGL